METEEPRRNSDGVSRSLALAFSTAATKGGQEPIFVQRERMKESIILPMIAVVHLLFYLSPASGCLVPSATIDMSHFYPNITTTPELHWSLDGQVLGVLVDQKLKLVLIGDDAPTTTFDVLNPSFFARSTLHLSHYDIVSDRYTAGQDRWAVHRVRQEEEGLELTARTRYHRLDPPILAPAPIATTPNHVHLTADGSRLVVGTLQYEYYSDNITSSSPILVGNWTATDIFPFLENNPNFVLVATAMTGDGLLWIVILQDTTSLSWSIQVHEWRQDDVIFATEPLSRWPIVLEDDDDDDVSLSNKIRLQTDMTGKWIVVEQQLATSTSVYLVYERRDNTDPSWQALELPPNLLSVGSLSNSDTTTTFVEFDSTAGRILVQHQHPIAGPIPPVVLWQRTLGPNAVSIWNRLPLDLLFLSQENQTTSTTAAVVSMDPSGRGGLAQLRFSPTNTTTVSLHFYNASACTDATPYRRVKIALSHILWPIALNLSMPSSVSNVATSTPNRISQLSLVDKSAQRWESATEREIEHYYTTTQGMDLGIREVRTHISIVSQSFELYNQNDTTTSINNGTTAILRLYFNQTFWYSVPVAEEGSANNSYENHDDLTFYPFFPMTREFRRQRLADSWQEAATLFEDYLVLPMDLQPQFIPNISNAVYVNPDSDVPDNTGTKTVPVGDVPDHNNTRNTLLVALVTAASVLAVVVVGCLFYYNYYYKSRRRRSKSERPALHSVESVVAAPVQLFPTLPRHNVPREAPLVSQRDALVYKDQVSSLPLAEAVELASSAAPSASQQQRSVDDDDDDVVQLVAVDEVQ